MNQNTTHSLVFFLKRFISIILSIAILQIGIPASKFPSHVLNSFDLAETAFADITQCNDGIDNDGDGYMDLNDLGCADDQGDDEGSEGPTGRHCRTDFSAIDGNLVPNPYFECDDFYQYGSRDPDWAKQDNIPDYWGNLYTYDDGITRWEVKNPDTHEKRWVVGESVNQFIPDDHTGKKAVVWHPVKLDPPEAPFTHDDRRDALLTKITKGFETKKWYKFECTFYVDNIMPIFNTDGTLNENLNYSEDYIGCRVSLYRANDSKSRSLLIDGPTGKDWSETDGVYYSWKPGDTGGWVTKSFYTYVPEGTTKIVFDLVNYGVANLYAHKMSFTPAPNNRDELIPDFAKEGDLKFLQVNGNDFFGIAMWGIPYHRSGPPQHKIISLSEIKQSGFNTVIKLGGCNGGWCGNNNEYKYSLDLKELEQWNKDNPSDPVYGFDTVYAAGYRGVGGIFNPPHSIPDFLKNRAAIYGNYVTRFSSFLGVYEDEPDCHGEGYLTSGLREWHWFKQKLNEVFQNNNHAPPIYFQGFCGDRGSLVEGKDIFKQTWEETADIFTYTQNFPTPALSSDSVDWVILKDVGPLMRYRLKVGEDAIQGQNGRNPIAGWAMPAAYPNYARNEPEWKDSNGYIRVDLARFQVYSQLVNGATGVNWFGMIDVDLDNSTHAKYFDDMSRINYELLSIKPALMQRHFSDSWDSDQYMEGMWKDTNGKSYLIMTNPSNQFDGDVQFTIKSSKKIVSIHALFEDSNGNYAAPQSQTQFSSRKVSFQGYNFSDHFAPYGVRIYEIDLGTEVCYSDGDCSTIACQAGSCVNNQCEYTQQDDGSLCSDGNACTQTDVCRSGQCVGENSVTCTALDQCHDVGICDTQTGVCSNPNKSDDSVCNDGSLCTQKDLCESGVCVGQDVVVCSASDQCHDAGECDPSNGQCSNPAKKDGVPCDDGQFCVEGEVCQAGICQGGSSKDCSVADDQCNLGVCDENQDACVKSATNEKKVCDDNNPCTSGETCNAGNCNSGAVKDCSSLDDVCLAGVCNEKSGLCEQKPANESKSCDDKNTCTSGEICQSGLCGGGSKLDCDDKNPCTADSCDPEKGCSQTLVKDGTSCSDGDVCNGEEICQKGNCMPGEVLACTDAEICDPVSGCVIPKKNDESGSDKLITTEQTSEKSNSGFSPIYVPAPVAVNAYSGDIASSSSTAGAKSDFVATMTGQEQVSSASKLTAASLTPALAPLVNLQPNGYQMSYYGIDQNGAVGDVVEDPVENDIEEILSLKNFSSPVNFGEQSLRMISHLAKPAEAVEIKTVKSPIAIKQIAVKQPARSKAEKSDVSEPWNQKLIRLVADWWVKLRTILNKK